MKGASCPTPGHSFAPRTRVLLADGSTKPIKDLVVGDRVAATDPVTGVSRGEEVVATHVNTDRKLTNLTVVDRQGRRSTLQTTENHPFWDAADRQWVGAGALGRDDRLRTVDKGDVRVLAAVSFTGQRTMYDLTVDDIHTYYVIAGNTPVLVHNCNRGGMDFTDAERQKVYDANLEANGGVLKCEYCGRDVVRRPSESGVPGRPDDAQIDHIEPRAGGGHGGAHNGAVACRQCNRDKSTKTVEQWDDELRELLD